MRIPSLRGASGSVARFRQRRRHGRVSALGPTLIGLVVASLAMLLGWIVFFSSLLAVETVKMSGQHFLTKQVIARAAAVDADTPLARVNLDDVQQRLEDLPAVDHVDVHRSWPHTISIKVTEREPIAVVHRHRAWFAMDKHGVVFKAFKDRPQSLPVVEIEVSSGAAAHQEVASVVTALPADLLARLKRLKARSMDSIELVLWDGRQIIWGSADESARKAEVVHVLLNRPGQVYDVSVPEQPTTKN